MSDFAVWLKTQDGALDPDLRSLQDFAKSNATDWPYASNELADYVGLISALPPSSARDRLLLSLSRYFDRWQGTGLLTKKGFWAEVFDHIGVIFFGLFALIVVGFLGFGLFRQPFFELLARPENARGLIAFLFAFSSIAIILLVAVATFWVGANELQVRFDKAKDLITLVIGVLGTILGFYFGSATLETPSLSIKNLSASEYVVKPGTNTNILATIVGGKGPYEYSIVFVDPNSIVNTKDMNRVGKKSENGQISESVPVPKDVSGPSSVTFTVMVQDSGGKQAESTGVLVVQP